MKECDNIGSVKTMILFPHEDNESLEDSYAGVTSRNGEIETDIELETETEKELGAVSAPPDQIPPEIEPHYEPCDDDGLEIPTKKAKKRKKSDGQSKSPAIIAFRRLTGHYPKTVNYQDVIDVLGEKPDEKKLSGCYREWCARGYNANSIKWLTDWYAKGIPGRRKTQDPEDEDYRRYYRGRYGDVGKHNESERMEA
jgi:hypothetical protein